MKRIERICSHLRGDSSDCNLVIIIYCDFRENQRYGNFSRAMQKLKIAETIFLKAMNTKKWLTLMVRAYVTKNYFREVEKKQYRDFRLKFPPFFCKPEYFALSSTPLVIF